MIYEPTLDQQIYYHPINIVKLLLGSFFLEIITHNLKKIFFKVNGFLKIRSIFGGSSLRLQARSALKKIFLDKFLWFLGYLVAR